MSYIAGNASHLAINGNYYAFTRCTYRIMADNQRTTNSESIGAPTGAGVPAAIQGIFSSAGFHTSINANMVVTVDATSISFDPSNNPFTSFQLVPNFNTGFVKVQLWMQGVPGFSIVIPSFHVIEGGGSIDIMALQPTDFRGESNGGFAYYNGGKV